MIPVNHSLGPANLNIYEVDPEQSEASREWNTYLAHHADYIRRNLVIGERYLLSEGELLEYFRNALGDGNCFFHSVIASCLSERTLGDDRELGRAVHSWSAIEMGRLVECGILDREFLADYLEFSGGTIDDAVRIAQTDQARPTIQFTLSHLIGRPIAYISRQSANRAENPRVGLYVPTDPSSALREPVFVAHEYYGVSSSADGGSGHYMVLRRRRQAQHLAPRSDSRSASLHCEGDKRKMEPISVGRNSNLVASAVLTSQKSHRESTSIRKLSSRKRRCPEKDKCRSCGTFLGRDGICSKCSKRVDRSPHAIGMVHEISGAMQCIQKNKTASSRSHGTHDTLECAQKCKISSCRKITIDNVQQRAQNSKVLSPRGNTAGNISKCAQNRKSSKSHELTTENARERVQNNETLQAEVGESPTSFGDVYGLQTPRSHVNSNRDGQKLDSSSVVIEMTDVFFNQVQFYFHVRNHLLNEESVFHCHNCLRWSTVGYPLRLKTIAAKDVICRKYVLLTRKSNRYSGKREYSVCEACFSYITSKRREGNAWAVAWPTFIAYNLVKAGFMEIWSWIPLELRVAWLPSVPLFHSSLSHVTLRDPPPFFEDCTERRLHLLEVIDRMRGAELRHALNENCVAQVRCYCGAQEFLEDTHLLSLQFALVRQYSQMSELGVLLPRSQANKDFMAASRSDWLHSWMFLEKWRVGPSVVVDSVKGLCLLVCREHKKGSLLKHVNLAYNPIQLNKPCSYPDRLGGLVVAPQIIKPLVKKYNVNTYEVLRLTGSYSGMSSSMLHTRRRWDITSSQLAESERLQVICRRDVRERLKHMLLSGEISDEIFSSLLESTHLSAAEETRLNYCKKSATLFDLDNLLDCRKALYEGHCNRRNVVSRLIEDSEGEKRVSYNLPWPFRLLKSSFNSCVQPLEIVPKKMKKKGTDSRYTWLLCTLLVNVSYLWSLVCEFVLLCERETWEGHLLKFISIKILKLNILAIGKENPYAKIKDPCGLEATVKSALEGHGEVEEDIASYLANLRTVSRYEISSHQLGNLQHHVEPSKSCKILILTRTDKSRLNGNEIPSIFEFDKRKYILRYVGFARSAIASDNISTFHAESCTTPLLSSTEFIHYSSATTYPNTVSCIPSQLTQHWTLLCYEISNKANLRQHRVDYMQSIDTTAVLFCTRHRLPLARDSADTVFTCCIDVHLSRNNCKRKSYVRCLSKSCSVCLCREHYQNFFNPNVPLPSELSRNLPSSESSSSASSFVPFSAEELYDPSCSSELSFLESESSCALSCTGATSEGDSSEYISSGDSVTTHSDSSISESGVSIGSHFADSCDIRVIENTDSSQVLSCFVDEEAEKTSIPRHIIFNVDSQLLKRNSRRITGTLAQRRYLHSIVSNDPGKSLPLINFEGDVFPSIFYNQADDGLFSGSIPQFLYNSEAENRYFGFASVDAMLRSRIKDGASLTGTDPRYIAHAFDAIVNLELRASDTRLVQSRGYEHLLGYHTHNPAESRMSFDSVDSRRRICELASFTKSSPEYFYTHTVSMRHHPGVSPIFVEAERQGYTDSDTNCTKFAQTRGVPSPALGLFCPCGGPPRCTGVVDDLVTVIQDADTSLLLIMRTA